MVKVFRCIKLMRPKHYIKNLLVLVPLFFDNKLFNAPLFLHSIYGVINFSLLSSIVYIINDIHDIESDRLHESKRNRPLASGEVSVKEAVMMCSILTGCMVLLNLFVQRTGWWILIIYFCMNFVYSIKLKQIPLLDIMILVTGFLLRLLYGSVLTDIPVSFWLCMTVMAASFYMGLGKRRNELRKGGKDAVKIRSVLKLYNVEFLDKNMYMCMGMAIVFYALWSGAVETIEKTGSDYQIWTVPLVIIIAMKYSLDIESGECADPVEVIAKDRWILFLGSIYILLMLFILYGN